MKSLTVSSIIALTVSSAAASIAVVEPWSDSTWKSGGEGLIQWTSDPKEYGNTMCNIQLMNGNPSNGQIVADITEAQAPIPCTLNEFKVGPLNDFTQGDYWIRIGQGEKWTYSHIFRFDGKGTVDTHTVTKPVSIRLSGGTAVSGGASGSQAPSSVGSSAAKPSASASASQKSGSNSTMSTGRLTGSPSSSAKASPSASSKVSEHNAVKDVSGADSFPKMAVELMLGTVVAGLATYFI